MNDSGDEDLDREGAAALLSRDPLIISTVSRVGALGLTEALGKMCRDTPAVFLIHLWWSCEGEADASSRADLARMYRAKHPGHEVIFLGNTIKEVEALRRAGAEAFFANHNIFVSENTFRPLENVPVVFDAVYNARPHPEKRHALAIDIPRVAYVGYPTAGGSMEGERSTVAELAARAPDHAIINPIADGMPRWIAPEEVNAALARAAVGLCLSAVEGAMYASMEYMLAGLPVVSTPSKGGRDVFFDPDYCLIAEPNPRAVGEAVAALRQRNIPREYVRARTLAKVEAERQRFLAFFEELKTRNGAPRAFDTRWPFPTRIPRWHPLREHARQMFGPDAGPAPEATPPIVANSDRLTTSIVAHALNDNPLKLAPARPARAWMDALPQNAAYGCLPMTIANAYGWEILCPVPIEIEWNGGATTSDLAIRALKPLPGNRPVSHFCVSHFGHGIATMHLGYIFRTDPGWNLFVSGAVNSPKQNAYPLSGIVDTDSLSYPFTMNWQVLSPGRARFEEGEPVCTIFPVRMETVANAKPRIARLADNPLLKKEYEAQREARERR